MLIYRQNYSALAHARPSIQPDPDIEWINSRLQEKRERISPVPVPASRSEDQQTDRPTPRRVAVPKGRLPSARPVREPSSYAPPILMEIERVLKRTGMTATTFGKEAVGDGRLVSDLRKGRDPSSRVTARVRAFIQAIEQNPDARPKGKSISADDLLPRIHRAMGAHGLSARGFGLKLSNDPSLMYRIGDGQNIRHATRERIVAFLDKLEGRV